MSQESSNGITIQQSVSPEERLRVFAAHQETMRQFLVAQESMTLQALAAFRGGEVGIPQAVAALEIPVPATITPIAAEPVAQVPAEVPDEPVLAFFARPRLVPISETELQKSLEGVYLLTEDGGPLAAAVRDQLSNDGAIVGIISDDLMADRAALATKMTELREKFGPVKGLVHLGGLSAGAMPEDLAGWKTLTTRQCKNFFNLLQACAADLRQTKGHVLAFSAMGGAFGRTSTPWPGLPSAGGFTGLLKTAAIEWPEVHLRAIDLPVIDAEKTAAIVLGELKAEDQFGEIGYGDAGRSVYEITTDEPEYVPNPAARLQASADWVVFATGGAQGITAVSLEEILEPGMTLVTVGRSPEPGLEPELTRGITDLSALRKVLLLDAKERGEKVNPAQIEKKIGALGRERAVRDNLERFRSMGVKVDYRSVDVGNGEAFAAVLDAVYAQYGRIDVALHGAGIIEDKLVVDKAPESFARVFDTKVDSTFVLTQKLRPDSLKWLIFFTSVAGRTGNRGQCDYATANETVNRLAWWLHFRWPGVKISSLNWGPWASGMASDEVNKAFLARGVVPIPPLAGRAFMRREMLIEDFTLVEKIAGIYRTPTA